MSRPLFEGLVFDPDGQPVGVGEVGGEPQYVVDDGGFKFHVPAGPVDREVLGLLREQIMANQAAVTEGTMKMLGQEDLFTKAMIDSSLKNIDEHFNRLIAQGLPTEARAYLGMLGFRVTINFHGEVISLDQPGMAGGPEEE